MNEFNDEIGPGDNMPLNLRDENQPEGKEEE